MRETGLASTIIDFEKASLAVVSLLWKIAYCLLAFFIGRKLIMALAKLVRGMMEKSRVSQGAITFVTSLIKIGLYVMLVLWIAVQFGLKESSVAALVASAGVGLGLALQGDLSNLAGGFQILMFQPFQVGDYIVTQGNEGTVQKIEILHTILQTMDNRKVVVPNGNLINNVIVNVTSADKRKLEIKVGISYEDSVCRAKGVLERLMKEEERILTQEEYLVFVAELSESSVILGIRCWVKTEDYYPVLWKMNERIKEEFELAGIHIPYRQLDVNLKS